MTVAGPSGSPTRYSLLPASFPRRAFDGLSACRAGWPPTLRRQFLECASRRLKDLFHCLAGIGFCCFGQMQVDHRRLQAAVTEIFLDDFQRHSRFQKMRGVGMPQGMNTNFLTEANLVDDGLHRFLHSALGHRGFGGGGLLVVPSFGGEE